MSGNKYVVTLVDYFSKWPEAEALPDECKISGSLLVQDDAQVCIDYYI